MDESYFLKQEVSLIHFLYASFSEDFSWSSDHFDIKLVVDFNWFERCESFMSKVKCGAYLNNMNLTRVGWQSVIIFYFLIIYK